MSETPMTDRSRESQRLDEFIKIQVHDGRFRVFDADGKPIHVGDTIEWVETSGPYGQTKQGNGQVTQELLVYGMVVTDGGLVRTSWEWKPKDGPEGLYTRHENHSYDHAHKTWARITNPQPTTRT